MTKIYERCVIPKTSEQYEKNTFENMISYWIPSRPLATGRFSFEANRSLFLTDQTKNIWKSKWPVKGISLIFYETFHEIDYLYCAWKLLFIIFPYQNLSSIIKRREEFDNLKQKWQVCDCNWTRTQDHLVPKRTLKWPVWPNGWVFV